MVRFARAEGSKGSNKRQLEEPTPWIEMAEQMKDNIKKKKSKKEMGYERNDTLEQNIKIEKKKADAVEQDIKLQNTFHLVKKHKSEANKAEENELSQTVQDLIRNTKKGKKGLKTVKPEYTVTPEGKRVKVFRDGTQRTWFDLPYEESDLMTRYEGMWVKQEMVGELDRLKEALEEEGLNKKEMMKKMMKAKRKAHRQLRIELIYQQKNLVSKATGEEIKDDTISKRKEKKKSNGFMSLKKNKKQKPFMMENDSLFSRSKVSHVKIDTNESYLENVNSEELLSTDKQMDDFPAMEGKDDIKGLSTNQSDVKNNEKNIEGAIYEVKENKSKKRDKLECYKTPPRGDAEDIITGEGNMKVTVTKHDSRVKKKKKIEKGKVKAEAVSQSNMEDCIMGEDEMTTKTDLRVKRKYENCKFEEEITLSQIEKKENSQDSEAKDCNSFLKKNLTQSHDFSKTPENPNSQYDFEENALMTNFDGYWVLREDVECLEAIKKAELEAFYAGRTEGTSNCEGELTQEEQLALQRAMKKKKRFYHRKLLKKLSKMGKKVDDGGKRMGNDKGKVKKDISDKVVKFDGFWVKKDAADRLHKLRKKLYSEGLSQQEVNSLVQKERRKEERVLKNERKLVCLNCRQPGHMVSACPNIVQTEGEGQPSICYMCGSTEHTSSTCNLKKGSEKSFSFATCYICKESGHISRQCPDNPRGLYPKGGACRGCGSVEHLAKDCPDLQKEKVEGNLRVGKLKGEELEALDTEEESVSDEDEASTHIKCNIPKVVKF